MGTTTFTGALLAQQQEARKGPECSISALLKTLDADTRADVRQALDDPTLQHTQIMRALTAIGHDIGATTIGRHRAGECKNCER